MTSSKNEEQHQNGGSEFETLDGREPTAEELAAIDAEGEEGDTKTSELELLRAEAALNLDKYQRAVADLADGLSGTFTSQARPESPHEINVLRVVPGAEVRRGRNVFLAEGAIASPDETLRPGAEGVARIRVGPRPVWWLATHRVVSALRLSYWL